MMKSNSWLILLLFLSASLAGCLENFSESSISLVVNQEDTDHKIVRVIEEGQLMEEIYPSVAFDFTGTSSYRDLVKIGIEFGEETYSVDEPKEGNWIVGVVFNQYGHYNLTAYAIDKEGNREEFVINQSINLEIRWSEEGTNEPTDIEFDPVPAQGKYADYFLVNSTVTNPEFLPNIGNGQGVDFTWMMIEPGDHTCQSKRGSVSDGASADWNTIEFNTLQPHSLRVQYDEGQDRIDILHIITVVFSDE